MTVDSDFLALAESHFVSLTTYRKSGEPVATTVWIARDGDDLLVTTPAKSGKVKRLRHDPRVQIVPCGRFGKVDPADLPASGTATIVDDPAEYPRLAGIFAAKNPIEYRIFMLIERFTGGTAERVILRISPR